MPKNKYIGYDDVVFSPGAMVDTLSLASTLYPEVAERMAKQDAFKTTSDYFITPRRFVKPTKLTSLLSSEYTGRAPGSPAYLTDITDDVTEGSAMLYPHGYINDTGYYFFRDKNNGRYYTLSKSEAPEVINPENFERISYDDLRKVLPAREYIGGPNYRRVVASRIPGFTDAVYKKAKDWGLDPNLMMHRIFKEGFIDSVASGYNDLATSERQKTYFDEDYSNRDIDGFHDFGLDDARDMLNNNIYTLNDPSATWESLGAINESGREVNSVIGHGLNSILEILAADLNYRRNKVKELYNVDDTDADRYTDAAFNRGLYSDKLNDHDFIVNEYSYPQYYNEDGTFNVKADGGLLDRLLHVYGNDVQSIRQAISGIKANTFRKGGRIFIKPENRGKFTALKKRTGHSASWFKAHGTPAQKRMAVFELNAAKWKHADGGPIELPSDNTRVVVPHPIPVVGLDISPKASVDRATGVHSNYMDAIEARQPFSKLNTLWRLPFQWYKDNFDNEASSGLSNCTLTATQWVDPANPIRTAASIISNPSQYGYAEIDSADARKGDLLIATTNGNGPYHTMLIDSIAEGPGQYVLNNKTYNYEPNTMLLSYSRGNGTPDNLRKHVPLNAYMENSDGKDGKKFYRYIKYPDFFSNIVLPMSDN